MQIRINPGEVQYMGMPGFTRPCLLAIDTIVNSEFPPRKASLVTCFKDRRAREQQEHLFLFWEWNSVPLTVVHSGFASEYSGEGPRGFSSALCMVHDKGIPLNWIHADKSQFDDIEDRRLTPPLIEFLQNAGDDPYPLPNSSWNCSQDINSLEKGEFWRQFHEPRLNSDWLDSELVQRCVSLFANDEESAIRNAYIVVEERLRELTGEDDNKYGLDLVNRALSTKSGLLKDSELPASEQEGLHQLFAGVFKAFRNPLAHRFVGVQDRQFNIELFCLADLLLKLLAHLHRRNQTMPNSG